MYNFNKWIEKNRSKKIKRNKKVSKFLPVFLVLIITAVSLTVLFKTNGFSKILNLLFKDPVYTATDRYVYGTLYENGNGDYDLVDFYIDDFYQNFSNREYLVNWGFGIDNKSEDFKNKDFLLIYDQHVYNNSSYFGDFTRNFANAVLRDSTDNNRIAIRYTFSDEFDDDDYSGDLETILAKANLEYAVYDNFSNGYVEAYEFLNNHHPAEGRDTHIIYITDDYLNFEKYKPFYQIIKNHYSNVTIHFGVGGNNDYVLAPFVRDYEGIADKIYYQYGWGLGGSILNGIDYYNNYTDIVVTMKLSNYVELIDYKDNTGIDGAYEVYEEGGEKFIRLTLPSLDAYRSQRNNLQTLLRLKDDVPDYVPLNKSIKIDYTTVDGIRKHITVEEALVVANKFTVEVDYSAPSDCNIENPPIQTYTTGEQVYYPDEPYCEGWVFEGWYNAGYSSNLKELAEGVFTGQGSIIFKGTWSKITINKSGS